MEEIKNEEKEIVTSNEDVIETSEEKEDVIEAEVVESEEVKEEPIDLTEFKGVRNLTKYDYRTMMYSNVYIVKYKRKTMLMYIVMLLIVLGLGIWNLVIQINAEKPSYIFPIIFLLFAVYILFQGLNVEKNLDRQIKNFFKGREVVSQENYINDDMIVIKRGNDDPIKIDWIQIQEIHEIPQFYMLFINPNSPIIVDKNPENMLEGTVNELKAIVDEKAKVKPYKKLDKNIVKRSFDNNEEIK